MKHLSNAPLLGVLLMACNPNEVAVEGSRKEVSEILDQNQEIKTTSTFNDAPSSELPDSESDPRYDEPSYSEALDCELNRVIFKQVQNTSVKSDGDCVAPELTTEHERSLLEAELDWAYYACLEAVAHPARVHMDHYDVALVFEKGPKNDPTMTCSINLKGDGSITRFGARNQDKEAWLFSTPDYASIGVNRDNGNCPNFHLSRDFFENSPCPGDYNDPRLFKHAREIQAELWAKGMINKRILDGRDPQK